MDLKEKRIGVLMGGWSGEREVSLRSGRNVHKALLARGYHAQALSVGDADELLEGLTQVGAVFNCLHGGMGEDGTLQALLEVLEVPYTGSGMLACALAMDKLRSKQAFGHAGLFVPVFVDGIDPGEPRFDAWVLQAVATLGLPAVVKPVREGSSLGVHIVQRAQELATACAAVAADFGPYFLEQYIAGRELTVGIVDVEGKPQAMPVLELRPRRAFYDYEAKYTPGLTEFLVPAPLDAATTGQAQAAALAAHRSLGCCGYSRVDVRLSASGEPFVLEVNTSPGMTDTSDLPQVAAAAGIPFDALVEYMLRSAIKPDAGVRLLVDAP